MTILGKEQDTTAAQTPVNDVLPNKDDESSLDKLRELMHQAAEKFDAAGRPMGGAKDD